MAHGLSCSAACGNLPGPGIEPVSPALAGRFPPTAPPGKPSKVALNGTSLNSHSGNFFIAFMCLIDGETDHWEELRCGAEGPSTLLMTAPA